MLFIVTRTSTRYTDELDENPSVPGALKTQVIRVDACTFRTPEDHDYHVLGERSWLSEGKNHRTTKDGITRDFDDEVWTIRADSAEELMEIVRGTRQTSKEGEIILGWDEKYHLPDGSPIAVLEVYDDYRE